MRVFDLNLVIHTNPKWTTRIKKNEEREKINNTKSLSVLLFYSMRTKNNNNNKKEQRQNDLYGIIKMKIHWFVSS